MTHKVGDVVYFRHDFGMETPLTVMAVNPESDGLEVGVLWLDASKNLCTYFTKRDVFMSDAEAVKLIYERDEKRRAAVMTRAQETRAASPNRTKD